MKARRGISPGGKEWGRARTIPLWLFEISEKVQKSLITPISKRVIDNLRLGAYHLHGESAKQEIEQAFATVFKVFPILKERSKQRAGTLSGGEQQMLAIGRGLMSRPQLLLLDEPSTGLAPFLVLELMDTLEKLRKETEVAILLAEQNAEAALKIADRGYVLGGGRVMIEGSRQQLIESDIVKLVCLGKVVQFITKSYGFL
jgi:branched-chain amino acid transport system ATP-binding protein